MRTGRSTRPRSPGLLQLGTATALAAALACAGCMGNVGSHATDKPTGALHASIIKRLGIDVSSYGSPAGSPLADL